MINLTELVIALAIGLFIIVGGSIAYNIWVYKQNKKGRKRK